VLVTALLAGGLAVGLGNQSAASPAPDPGAAALSTAPSSSAPDTDWLADRGEDAARVSRDTERAPVVGPSLQSVKRASMAGVKSTVGAQRGRAKVGSADLAVAYDDPRDIARAMIGDYGWSSTEFNCLDQLYISESGWDVNADNPTSSAYGIPQALPGEKMASAGADWRTNPATQIEWGLGYIRDVYGTPCSAMSFKSGNGWY
jgi:hypothetical protein